MKYKVVCIKTMFITLTAYSLWFKILLSRDFFLKSILCALMVFQDIFEQKIFLVYTFRFFDLKRRGIFATNFNNIKISQYISVLYQFLCFALPNDSSSQKFTSRDKGLRMNLMNLLFRRCFETLQELRKNSDRICLTREKQGREGIF